MGFRRYAGGGRRDANEKAIIATLEAHRCVVWQLSGTGVADLLVFSPEGLYVADVKQPKGKVEPTQEEKWGALARRGYPVYVLRTPEDAVAMLKCTLKPWSPSESVGSTPH